MSLYHVVAHHAAASVEPDRVPAARLDDRNRDLAVFLDRPVEPKIDAAGGNIDGGCQLAEFRRYVPLFR